MSDVCHRREYEAPADSVPHRLVGCGFAHRAVFDSDAACGFLAMADIVNRMRDAFLALDSTVARPTYTTGVDLIASQAHEGTRVPVNFMAWPSCPVCGGCGEFTGRSCSVCDGTGVGRMSYHVQLQIPPGVRHGTRLRCSVTPTYAAEAQIEFCVAVQ